MLPPQLIDRADRDSVRVLTLHCWFVRLAWPTGLVFLLIVSLPRVTTLSGMIYLVVVDLTGILAGLQSANWLRDGAAKHHAQETDTEGIDPQSVTLAEQHKGA